MSYPEDVEQPVPVSEAPTVSSHVEKEAWQPPTVTPHDVTPLGGPISGASDNATFHS